MRPADELAQGLGEELEPDQVLQRALPQGAEMRNLVLVLGDQLDLDSSAFDGFDPAQDAVWMAEVLEESRHVWSSQPRSALFLSAMRHFAEQLRAQGRPLHYRALDDADNRGSLAAELRAAIVRLQPRQLVLTAPGDWRVLQDLQAVARETGLALELREDRHFFSSVREFAQHARGRKQLRLEYWYRELRRRHAVLLTPEGEPEGGAWNFDSDNREPFGKSGPGAVPAAPRFEPDALTRQVLALVRERLAEHPGLPGWWDDFAWPVTRAQALQALDAFVRERLSDFGRHQDALWPAQPTLWHSLLASSLNLKLLNAREVVAAAEAAYRAGRAPLASVEGFIRQILGWREYVRGVYWTQMPDYLARNELQADEALPAFYWTGETDMACLRDALTQTLRLGYAHHIQRLMVTGLYALLLGVRPQQLHAWYLAVYVDAVEWVELPNTLGMSQYADGGVMASKPYIASGAYIERMSTGRLCAGCRFKPRQRVGAEACPFTTLYWDFLLRHEDLLAANPRLGVQVRNLARLDEAERQAIRGQAAALRPKTADPGAAAVAEPGP
jgi:deoxyribodipyrimidine photolyase-related protein